MTKKLHAFLAGMGSVLVIQPTTQYKIAKVPDLNKSISEVLGGDFNKVGNDLRNATIKVVKSSYGKNEKAY